MNLNRAVQIASILLILLVVSLAWWTWEFRLPAPAQCNQDQLYRWMALRDLEQEPEQTQLELLERFEELIKNGGLGGSVEVDSRYAGQVDRNRSLLQDLWFEEAVREFHCLDVGRRAAFVDEQLGIVHQWQAMADDSDQDAVSAMRDQLNQWLGKALPTEQPRVLQALSACFIRWLAIYDLQDFSFSDREQIAEGVMEQIDADEIEAGDDGLITMLQGMMPPDTGLLSHNGDLLLEAWFHSQARKYRALSKGDREAFVADQIAMVKTSPLVPLVVKNRSPEMAVVANPIAAAMQLMKAVDSWIDRAESDDQPMLKDFKLAVQSQFLKISLPWKRTQ